MPKINVYAFRDDSRRVEVGWQPNGGVQVGSVLRNPVKVDAPEGVTVSSSVGASQVRGGTVDGDGWTWEGQFTDLDRHGINQLIRALREARDKAYGRDE